MPSTITPMIIEDDDKVVVQPVKIAPKIAPKIAVTAISQPLTMPRIQIAKNLLATTSTKLVTTPAPKLQTASNGNMPFPLLILNNGQNGQKAVSITNGNINGINNNNNAEVSNLLKELLTVQKENLGVCKKSLEIQQEWLEVERQRMEYERQKLEYQHTLGSQIIDLAPTIVDIFQKVKEKKDAPAAVEEVEDTKNFVGHPNFEKQDPISLLKNNKDFKEAILDGIKKFMQQGASDTETVTDSV